MASPVDPSRLLTRRGLLGAAAACTMLAGCRAESDEVLASAARGSRRHAFLDNVGWVDLSGTAATIAFLGRRLSDRERVQIVENRGVYPVISGADPSLELRIELKPGADPRALSISKETLEAVQLTFWHFDDPPPVIRIERDDVGGVVFGLSGDMKRGGWAIGTVRGQQIYSSAAGRESYAWNLGFQASLV